MEAGILYASQARDLYGKGQYNESLERYNQSVRADPHLLQGWMGRGDVLYAMGRYNESAGSYIQVTVIRPSDADAWRGAGNAYREAGEYQASVHAYTRALTVYPGKAGVQENLTAARAALEAAPNKTGNVTPPVLSGSPDRSTVLPVTNATMVSTTIPSVTDANGNPAPASPVPTRTAPIPATLVALTTGFAFIVTQTRRKR